MRAWPRASGERLPRIIEQRIVTRKPAPYLTNQAWMLGHSFYVDERVIVPRSYIGELLQHGLSAVVPDPEDVERVLDLCTGSGCLAILAALSFDHANVDGVDLSADALEVAKRNVGDYGLETRVRLMQSDSVQLARRERYDLIISNPPYVTAEAVANFPARVQGRAGAGPCRRRGRAGSRSANPGRGAQSTSSRTARSSSKWAAVATVLKPNIRICRFYGSTPKRAKARSSRFRHPRSIDGLESERSWRLNMTPRPAIKRGN